jgi:hypothetical protein
MPPGDNKRTDCIVFKKRSELQALLTQACGSYAPDSTCHNVISAPIALFLLSTFHVHSVIPVSALSSCVSINLSLSLGKVYPSTSRYMTEVWGIGFFVSVEAEADEEYGYHAFPLIVTKCTSSQQIISVCIPMMCIN